MAKNSISLVEAPDYRKLSAEAWAKWSPECTESMPPLYDFEDLPDGWLHHLLWGEVKKSDPTQYAPRACMPNAITILRNDPRWRGVIAYDEFGEEVVTLSDPPWHAYDSGGSELGPWTDEDTTRICSWFLRAYGMAFAPERLDAAVQLVAKSSSTHPVREWLATLTWDGKQRIDSWLTTYLHVVESPYTRAVGAAFLVALVARAMRPGCKADAMIVLEGNQGVRKSTALRTLVGDAWYLEIVGGIDPKETPQQFRRKWLVEIGELSAMRRTDLETFKGFVSRTADNYRPPYAKRARDFRRQCLMAGSTNAYTYLHDETGGRRFWPVRVTKEVSIDALARDRAMLLAEALVRLEAGAIWHLTDPALLAAAKAEQDSRYQEDPWHDRISEWVYSPAAQRATRGVTVSEILTDCLKVEIRHQDRAGESRVGAVLRRLGWEPSRKVVNGERIRRYHPGDVSGQPGQPWPTPPVGHTEHRKNGSENTPVHTTTPLSLDRGGIQDGQRVFADLAPNSQRVSSDTPKSVGQVGRESEVDDIVDDLVANPPLDWWDPSGR